MPSDKSLRLPRFPLAVLCLLAASAVFMVTLGIRQSVGLYVQPLSVRGLSIVEISFALAVGQLSWGVFQPVFGIWADKKSPFAVLLTGCLCLATAQVATIWADSMWTLILTQGVLGPAGAAATSFPVLIALVATRLKARNQAMAGGIVNAGGSLGQFVFAPLVEFVVRIRDFSTSLLMLAVLSLAAIFPAWFLCKNTAPLFVKAAADIPSTAVAQPVDEPAPVHPGLCAQLRVAFGNSGYILLHLSYLTCGFHVAFLTTHLPGEVAICGYSTTLSAASLSLIGLFNIAGSIGVGILGRYYRMKNLLTVLYASRALMIVVYLCVPKTEMTFYIFSAAIGLTWLATVPPTAALVGKLFGMRYLATLYGFTMLSHQIGGFFGAWLGGIAVQASGNFLYMWYADIALAVFAALTSFAIREARPASV
jgi:predicted MFS family arabinose efflux permease